MDKNKAKALQSPPLSWKVPMSAVAQTRDSFPNGNLHFKPISARLSRGVLSAAFSMQQRNAFFSVVAAATLFVGSFFCALVASVEAVAGSALGSLGILLNLAFCEGKSPFLQKHSLKALSFALHSAILSVSLVVLGLTAPRIPLRTIYILADHALHLGSAAFVQMTLGARWTNERSAGVRMLGLLRDDPNLLQDLIEQARTDLDHANLLEISREICGSSLLGNHLVLHPEDREFLTDFDFRRLLEDREYVGRGLGALRRFLADRGMVRPEAANPFRLELNRYDEAEQTYQRHLAQLLKASFIEIHRTPNLSRCLDTTDHRGTELLELLDATIYTPLTTYAQYREILGEIRCPLHFSENLTQYSTRRVRLVQAKNQVDALTRDQREALVQKILRGSDLDVRDEAVQQAFIKISELAPPLYQGPLMTQTMINLEALETGGDFIETRNLFQNSCQEALAEIGQT